MAGTNNFLQWNPTEANQENDAAYASDSARSGGAGTGSIFTSQTANKLFFQTSTMVAALAAMMAVKNYNMQDSNLGNLQTALSNLLTNADVTSSFGAAGYFKIAGFMIQWGTTGVLPDSSYVTKNFTVAFPTGAFGMVGTQTSNTGTNNRPLAFAPISNTQYQVESSGSGCNAFWIAVGN